MADNVRSPTILTAGIDACVAANGSGTTVGITHIALGSGRKKIVGNETALVNEKYRAPISGSAKLSSSSWQVFSNFSFDATQFDCTEIGFFVNSTLFAYFSIAPTSSEKIFSASNITTTVDYTLDLSVVPVGSVTIVVDASASVSNLILGNHIGASDPHPQYITDAEAKAIAWGNGRTSAPWAPLASPAFTGTPTTPTLAGTDNTIKLANAATVHAIVSNDRPFEATATNIKANGTQAVGVLNTVARADHVHPTDTTLAPLASPTLTGVPTAPTATSGTNNNQIATTAFVNAAIENYSPKIELTYGDGV